ncbi:MAG: glucose-6-phosphate dehydrogenase assembly protein OpcA [Verrucomicrobia bacterium]|nr:glucose-6-phosphate dehydrogenase assembly protein OpcA [Verrucomicrobiota bacterium]
MAASLHLVAPSAIQDELNRIWESLETTNTTRACLFNLIFYTKKTYRAAYIQRLAQAVIEKFPARVIFITVDGASQEDSLKTQVSILTSSKGEYDVACDFIQIDASGASKVKIPFVILPHILPDLPVYLVMAEDPSHDDQLANELKKFVHRLIFDSEATDNLSRFASSALSQASDSQVDIADLNWARIESWREMLSAAFYSPDRIQELNKINSVQLTYNSCSSAYFCHTRIQALYLQAWLACQLKWTLSQVRLDKDIVCIDYMKQKSPLEISLIPMSNSHLPPGLILNMDLTTSEGTHFSFLRDFESIHQITLNISTPRQCELPCKYIFAKAESGHSLVKEICHRGTSQHFINTLKLVKQMDGQGLC